MTEKNIKPIPKYIEKLIKRLDDKDLQKTAGQTRFYAYLTKNDGELVKVTVAVKTRYKKWYCKQVAVHGVHSKKCYVKDIAFYYICGYVVDWYKEQIQAKKKDWDYENCWGIASDEYFDPYAPVVNPEYALKFPEYKYSAADKYNRVNILKYLRLYEKYPQAEMLVKFGLSKIATSRQILNQIGKDKTFRKWIITHRDEIITNDFYISAILLAHKQNRQLFQIQQFEKLNKKLCSQKDFTPIRELFNTAKLREQFFSYINKQKISFRIYLDYLIACNFLEIDMTQDKNRFPHDFFRWHNIRIDEYSVAKQSPEIVLSKFYKVASKYLNLQDTSNPEFLIIIAKSPDDLVREGKVLGHCVGRMGYDAKFMREESLIFFVRNAAQPNMPLYTIEYSLRSKSILQCYGHEHETPKGKISDYITNVWLPHANKQLTKIKRTKQIAA